MKLIGIEGRPPTESEREKIRQLKWLIWDGVKKALAQGVPRKAAAILCDEEYGERVLLAAKRERVRFAVPVEKSGEEEFQFAEADWPAHIERFQPTFVKALVRYNPEADQALNQRQRERLAQLSTWCSKHGYPLLLELLVPPTDAQLAQVGGEHNTYDLTLRPKLAIQAIDKLQDAAVEPSVWKLEGFDNAEDAERAVATVRRGGRQNVGIVILGRDEAALKVRRWLEVGANIPGMIGFAIGRTIFEEPLESFLRGRQDEEGTISQIAENYKGFVDIWFE